MNYKLAIAILFLVFNGLKANAQDWGYGICCVCGSSPCPCGIIPCDSSCGGRALTQMGSSVSSSGKAASSAYQALSTSLNTVNQTVAAVGSNLVTALNEKNSSLLKSISAGSKRIELSIAQEGKSEQHATDHFINQLRQSLTDLNLVETVNMNNAVMANPSQPVSSMNTANGAPVYARIRNINKQIFEKAYADFIERAGERQHKSLPRDVTYTALLEALSDNAAVESAVVESDLRFDQLSNWLQFVEGLIMPVPPSGLKSVDSSQLVEMRRNKAVSTALYSTLLDLSLRNIRHDAESWADYYNDFPSEYGGAFSAKDVLQSETDSRLYDQSWWLSIKTLDRAGIHREIVYQEALEAAIDRQRGLLIEQGIRNKALFSDAGLVVE